MGNTPTYYLVNRETSCNSYKNFIYIVIDKTSREAAVVDPAWELDSLYRIIREYNADLTTVLLTHSHYDHVNMVEPLLDRYDARVYMHKREIEFYRFACKNLHPLSHLDSINLGQTVITCLSTPGHTAGGACFLLSGSLFTGDTIFIEGCGICSTSGGNAGEMFDSIQAIREQVEPGVCVYPGHSYGMAPGYPLSYLLKNNIYFHIPRKDDFVKYRRKKDQHSPYRALSAVRPPGDKNNKQNRSQGPGEPRAAGPISSPAIGVVPAALGDEEFKADHKVRYAYAAGGMCRGISSRELVVRMGKAGLISYFGTSGLGLNQIRDAIRSIREQLDSGQPYGMNVSANPADPGTEEEVFRLFLKYGIKNIEASGYLQVTPSLVMYRARGLKSGTNGRISTVHKIMAKVSRPEAAEKFLSPAPGKILKRLVAENNITRQEADLAGRVPMADDLCVTADSAGYTDREMAYALLPAIMKLRDEIMVKYGYTKRVRVGAAGGIGTPAAAAAAFILGADFILTGSINQCSVEAGTSPAVKNLLQRMNIQDTDYVPAKDMFEMGARAQVLKRGLFFPARAKKLYELYCQYQSLDEIETGIKKTLQEKYFKRSFADIYAEARSLYPPGEIRKADTSPRHKMALIFKWYLDHALQLALKGNAQHKLDYQVFCGPALGAFNQWIKGTELEDWRNRHVDVMAEKLMQETAVLLNQRLNSLSDQNHDSGQTIDRKINKGGYGCNINISPLPARVV